MSKRVNIQYTIDLEQLPNEIDRIYAGARDIFTSLSLPKETGKEILTADVLNKLDETRRELTNLDHILNDVTGIVSSYVQYELALRKSEQQDPPEPDYNAEHPSEMSK